MRINHPLAGAVDIPDGTPQADVDGIMNDLDRRAGQQMAARAALDPLARVAMEMANPKPRPRPVSALAAFSMSPQQLANVQGQRQGAYEFDQNQELQREEMQRRAAMQQQQFGMQREEMQQRVGMQREQIGAQTKHYENMTALDKIRYEAQDKRAADLAAAKQAEAEKKAQLGTIRRGADGNDYVDRVSPETGEWESVLHREGKKTGGGEKPPKYVTRTYPLPDGTVVQETMTEAEAVARGPIPVAPKTSASDKSPEEIAAKAYDQKVKNLSHIDRSLTEINRALKDLPAQRDPVTGQLDPEFVRLKKEEAKRWAERDGVVRELYPEVQPIPTAAVPVQAPAGAPIRKRYNPQTGELE